MPTPNLGLPFIAQGQAQKEVTHNEALRILDTLVQLAVLDRDLSAPPGSPSEGQRWIVGASPTGAWAGHANHIAAWQDGAWQFSVPKIGWLAYVIDEGSLLAWDGSAWVAALEFVLDNLSHLGINTTADANNRLAVKSNGALFSHDDVTPGTGDMRVSVNKATANKDASFVFYDAWSPRAMFGLLADDDFVLKTSPDGASFFSAARVFNWCGRADVRDSARRRYVEWFPNVNTTTLNAQGLTSTITGTATAAALSNVSMFAQSPRLIFASAAAAGSSAGVNGAQLIVWRGSSGDRGGFYLLMRFGWETPQAQGRCFAGLRGSTAAIGNVNPSTLTDIIGIGFDSGQTTMRILSNDASGTASALDLGANFTSNQGHDFYELMLSAEPGGSEVKWRVERLNSGHIATGTINADLPAAGTFLTPHLWGNNGTTAAAVQIALHTMYLENASLYGSRGF
ncbi:MAG TPA: DUF2793 domain-containing protein [Xanthobacteraceae bacterium]|nr:DUF2793 domain-containing protein [Xanthobacteraceae bacterium]